jgi:hypothetical protein
MKQIPVAELRAMIRLESETGRLFWLPRQADPQWTARYAGREALRTTNGSGYRHGTLAGTTYLAHRVVWALYHGAWALGTIDHIDGNRQNNTPSNLRDVSHSQNLRNQRKRRSNKSGHNGVSWSAKEKRWIASISVGGGFLRLGSFLAVEDAIFARKAADRKFGFHENHGCDPVPAEEVF